MEENYQNQFSDEYNDDMQEEAEEFDEELPPEAKEYYEYKNKIDIMEKEKKLLQSNLIEAKKNLKEEQNFNKKILSKKRQFSNDLYDPETMKDFTRLTDIININTFGSQPIVMYKKIKRLKSPVIQTKNFNNIKEKKNSATSREKPPNFILFHHQLLFLHNQLCVFYHHQVKIFFLLYYVLHPQNFF